MVTFSTAVAMSRLSGGFLKETAGDSICDSLII